MSPERGKGEQDMAKKATAKKVTGIVMATRGPKELHRAVTVAAKADGITLGAAILRGLELYVAALRKAGR